MEPVEQIQVGIARNTLRLAELASGWPGADGMRALAGTIDGSKLPAPYQRTVQEAAYYYAMVAREQLQARYPKAVVTTSVTDDAEHLIETVPTEAVSEVRAMITECADAWFSRMEAYFSGVYLIGNMVVRSWTEEDYERNAGRWTGRLISLCCGSETAFEGNGPFNDWPSQLL
jgi:hypothetical protein